MQSQRIPKFDFGAAAAASDPPVTENVSEVLNGRSAFRAMIPKKPAPDLIRVGSGSQKKACPPRKRSCSNNNLKRMTTRREVITL